MKGEWDARKEKGPMKKEEFDALIGPVFGNVEKHWKLANDHRKGSVDLFDLGTWMTYK